MKLNYFSTRYHFVFADHMQESYPPPNCTINSANNKCSTDHPRNNIGFYWFPWADRMYRANISLFFCLKRSLPAIPYVTYDVAVHAPCSFLVIVFMCYTGECFTLRERLIYRSTYLIRHLHSCNTLNDEPRLCDRSDCWKLLHSQGRSWTFAATKYLS
jgi:hypothetical protein